MMNWDEEIKVINLLKSMKVDCLSNGYTEEQFEDLLIKAKKDITKLQKKEVWVERGGKRFKQTVYVKGEDEIGEQVTPEIMGLDIVQYSAKAIAIKGDTYANKDLMREIKSSLGVGGWNAKLKAWIFPSKYKEQVLGYVWSDVSDEEKKDAIQNQKNELFSKGDEVNISGEKGKVTECVSDSEGIKYNITLEDGTKLEGVDEKTLNKESELDDKQLSEVINNTNESNRNVTEKKLYGIKPVEDIHKYSLQEYMAMHGLSQEDIDKAVNAFTKKSKPSDTPSSGGSGGSKSKPAKEGLTKRQLIGKLIYKHYKAVQDAIERGDELPEKAFYLYEDLKAAYSKKRKEMTEETKRKISEALKKNKVDIKDNIVNDVKDSFKDLPDSAKKAQKDLADLIEKKDVLEKKKYDLYEKRRETPIDSYEKKNEIDEALDSVREDLHPLDKKIRNQKNVVKVLSNGGSLKNISDKVGVEHKDIPDFRKVDTSDISYDIDNILIKEKPNYIPEISEEDFKSGSYIFDVIKVDDDSYMIATDKYREKERIKDGFSTREGEYNPKNANFVMLTLDQLVLTQDYYITKKKALNKKKADESNQKQLDHWNGLSDSMKERYLTQKGMYRKIPAKVKKQISESEWDNMSWQEREKYYKPIKRYGVERIKSNFDSKHMATSFHSMYERFVDPEAKRHNKKGDILERGESTYGMTYANPKAWDSWQDFRKTLDWKINDINIQREEVVSDIRKKALETSYGETNSNYSLVDDYGVKVKRQNGDTISPLEIDQLKDAWKDVQKSFGSLKQNAKDDGLTLSHAGKTYMYASKAIGVYYPSFKSIGVTNKLGDDQLGFTMSHETAHWIDDMVGRKDGRRHASDNFDSTAGKIANTLRLKMNKASKSNYINATHECFARSMEMYHAIETKGYDALRGKKERYIESPEYVSKDVYEKELKPLIKQFLEENKDLLKSLFG